MSGFHFDPICQIKCNNAMQVGCKAARHALDPMFLTNDQADNGCRLQRVSWLNRLRVFAQTGRQEEEANWLYTHTASVSRDKSVLHLVFFPRFLIRIIPGLGVRAGWHGAWDDETRDDGNTALCVLRGAGGGPFLPTRQHRHGEYYKEIVEHNQALCCE